MCAHLEAMPTMVDVSPIVCLAIVILQLESRVRVSANSSVVDYMLCRSSALINIHDRLHSPRARGTFIRIGYCATARRRPNTHRKPDATTKRRTSADTYTDIKCSSKCGVPPMRHRSHADRNRRHHRYPARIITWL